jgi:peptidoglycan/LPS O-acetylase OafA/YrhL
MAPQNLKQLTSLRFFAATWVVLYHYWPHLTPQRPPFVAKGYLGVELFFVLSGFIICHVYLERFGEKRASYPEFLWARLSRIYPLHIVILAGLCLLLASARLAGLYIGDKMAVISSLPAHILLLQAWGLAPGGGWNHPSWSISAEWFAYLAFPVFAWVTWRLRSSPWTAIIGACLMVVALNVAFTALTGKSLTDATIAWGAVRIVPCFSLGCAVYLLWSSNVVTTQSGALLLTLVALAASIAVTILNVPDWMAIITFGALILGLAELASTGSTLLTARIWIYLGEVSFAIYMICIPWELVFQNATEKLAHTSGEILPLRLWVLLVLGVTPAAMLIHHLVERPARTLMRRHGVPFLRRKLPA